MRPEIARKKMIVKVKFEGKAPLSTDTLAVSDFNERKYTHLEIVIPSKGDLFLGQEVVRKEIEPMNGIVVIIVK